MKAYAVATKGGMMLVGKTLMIVDFDLICNET